MTNNLESLLRSGSQEKPILSVPLRGEINGVKHIFKNKFSYLILSKYSGLINKFYL